MIPEFINRIDWKLLKRQKASLMELATQSSYVGICEDDIDGIIQIIDSLQDYAVDVLEVPEKDVFE